MFTEGIAISVSQSGVRHIITGFFLGAGNSAAEGGQDGRPLNWQATQHRNRLQASRTCRLISTCGTQQRVQHAPDCGIGTHALIGKGHSADALHRFIVCRLQVCPQATKEDIEQFQVSMGVCFKVPSPTQTPRVYRAACICLCSGKPCCCAAQHSACSICWAVSHVKTNRCQSCLLSNSLLMCRKRWTRAFQ